MSCVLFELEISPFISTENVVKKLNVPEHTVVSMAMWDLPGREEMDLRTSYYKDVDAAIGKIVFLTIFIYRTGHK